MLELHLHQESKKSNGDSYFIEELSNAQFTTYANVTSLAGVTQGNAHNEGTGWLRFEMDGKELIVSKKPIRSRISWNYLNSVGCVFGSKIITILGNQYKVRLLTGADTDPTQVNPATGHYVEGSHNSEWSRLFYPLVNDDVNLPIRDPNAPYTGVELGMDGAVIMTGSQSWCQETHQAGATNRVLRGYLGASFFNHTTYSYIHDSSAWRPCLELIPPMQEPLLNIGYYFNETGTFFAPNQLRGTYVSDLNTI